MLSVLRIQNLAIVEELEVEFGSGLNVLTGETGAGKSIILKAIELLTGRRASADIIRSGAPRCIVEGLFRLDDAAVREIIEVAEELVDLDIEEGLLIRRVIEPSGRSKIYLNGSLGTANVLQRIAAHLLDITGQHQQQSLLMPENHLRLLDHYGVKESLREETAEAYALYAKATRDLKRFLDDSEAQILRLTRLKAEQEEFEAAALKTGEREELETELKRLANVEDLASYTAGCLELLETAEDGIEDKVRSLLHMLGDAVKLDNNLEEVLSLVDSASVQLSEAVLSLTDYSASLEDDPTRSEYLRERIALIARLERKYGKKQDDLVVYAAQVAAEIAEFEAGSFDEKRLKARVVETEKALRVLEEALRAERTKAAEKLAKQVEKELASLGMKKARFRVRLEPRPSGPHGADEVEFMLAANPGEPFRSLAKVASGGELSRILLVLKTLLNEKNAPRTQIFDEIDTGIGGAVSRIVGEKLQTVSEKAQVLIVTHAPQIAALADSHYLISKKSAKNRTQTAVKLLGEEERVQQIASMLAGKEVTPQFEASARVLLERA